MQKRIKLSVINGSNINAIYGIVMNYAPLTIYFEQCDIFNKYDVIIYSETTLDARNIYFISVIEINDNIVVFEKIRQINDIFFKNYYLEFSHIFSIAQVNEENEHRYKLLASNINKQEINSTSSRLKEVISRDEVENREIIAFLIDINSKIDEILYLLKPKEKIEGAAEYLSLIIGEEGLFFASKNEIISKRIFIYTTIRDSSGFLNFASICNIEKFINTDNYIIYKGLFIDLSSDIKDKLIKYIFRLEREILKEANR